jgi:hypothetical protein
MKCYFCGGRLAREPIRLTTGGLVAANEWKCPQCGALYYMSTYAASNPPHANWGRWYEIRKE